MGPDGGMTSSLHYISQLSNQLSSQAKQSVAKYPVSQRSENYKTAMKEIT
jgi:hypothetical protein